MKNKRLIILGALAIALLTAQFSPKEALNRLLGTNTIWGSTGLAFQIDTLATLKAINTLSATAVVSNGQVVHVLGYYAAGDGGGGDFYFSSASVIADNGGTVIAPTTGTGRWIRFVADGFVSARQFGAKGDGVSDDEPFIQAASTWLAANGGGKIGVGGGRTYLGSSLSLAQGTMLEGFNQLPYPRDPAIFSTLRCVLLLKAGTTINMGPLTALKGVAVLKSGMTFPQNAAAVATWADTAVTIPALSHSTHLTDVVIVGFAHGVDQANGSFCEKNTFERMAIDCQAGIRIFTATDRDLFYWVNCWPIAAIGLGAPVDADYQRSGNAFELTATGSAIDSPSFIAPFAYGYATAYRLTGVNGASFVDAVADYTATKSVTVRGWYITGDSIMTQLANCKAYRQTKSVDFEPTQPVEQLLVSNFDSEFADTNGFYITNGSGSITGSTVRNLGVSTTYGVELNGVTGSTRFSVDDCFFDYTTNALALTNSSPGNTMVVSNPRATGNGTNTFFTGSAFGSYASASTLVIPAAENGFTVTGTTTINLVDKSYAWAGRRITIQFAASVTVKYNQSPSGTGAAILLVGAGDFSATANDTLTLIWNGTAWVEEARAVI